MYITVQGDKWDEIAYKVYGDTRFTDTLFAANPQYRKIYIFSAGIELETPEIGVKLTTDYLPPWKKAMT